jgi:predicted nucleic acid-binding protein
MKCLPDTSAWSLLFRRRGAASSEDPVALALRRQIEGEGEVVLTGIVLQEVLQGVRQEKQRAELSTLLRPFPMLNPNRETHEEAARLRDRCLRRGISAATIDVLIAQLAIENDCVLLTADGDFTQIASVCELQLLAS